MSVPTWPSTPGLRTSRLDLEPLRVEHADKAATALADPALHRHTRGHPAGPDEPRDRYARQVVGHSPDGRHGWLNWVLRERSSGRLVGTVQATTSQAADGTRCAELALGRRHRSSGPASGRRGGVGRRSVVDVRDTAVLVAHVHPDNLAPAVTTHRLGMNPTPAVVDGEVEWRGRSGGPSR